MEQIRIVSIPEQIIFYKGKDDNKVEISNGEIVNINTEYSLYQIKTSMKYDGYYDLYYQGMAKELEFTNFYSKAHFVETQGNSVYSDYEDDFKQNIFYGRTNKLSFRLCYEFCKDCYEIGGSINDQRCESCLPEYSYDYWNYFNKTYSSNCVPSNYMNDIENNQIVPCDSAHPFKSYHNKTIK